MVQKPRTTNQEMDNRRARVAAIMTAPAWRPTTGDSITGTVVSVRAQDMKDPKWSNPDGGNTYPVFTYELDEPFAQADGSTTSFVALHVFHTSLYNQLKELKTRVGSRTAVAYGGKKIKNGFEDLPADKQESVQVYQAWDPDDPTAGEGGEYDWGNQPDDPQF